jgi:hypothetical protein
MHIQFSKHFSLVVSLNTVEIHSRNILELYNSYKTGLTYIHIRLLSNIWNILLHCRYLKIHANFHENFENAVKSKILWSEQRK